MKALSLLKSNDIFNSIDYTDSECSSESIEMQQYFLFLNEYAESNKIALSLYNKSTLKYENITPYFYRFWGLKETDVILTFQEFYPKVLEDINQLITCVEVHEAILENFSNEEKMYFTSTFCGAKAKTFGGEKIRLFWNSIPLVVNGKIQSKILMCCQGDITQLMEDDKYWIRITAKDKVYTWFSDQKKIRNKEIVSPIELICIKNWAKGMKPIEIAELNNISVHTVNNHLKAARNRIGARNNSALADFCNLLSI